MTADERDTIRAAVDKNRRAQLAAQQPERHPGYQTRRQRLLAACAKDSPVQPHNQVRAVLRMLEQCALRDGRREQGA